MTRLNDLLFSALGRMEARNRARSLVGAGPFFDTAAFSWVPRVEAETPSIQSELASMLARVDELPNLQDISPEQRELSRDDRWKSVFFVMGGRRVAGNCDQCPATERALRNIPGLVSAFYSILAPGKRLAPHRGPYNGILRFHLGLKIPARDMSCAIRVGGETRHWDEGVSMVFDDTYEHEAWNLTPAYRAVLFVDFKRPLPLTQAIPNDLMIWLSTKTPFVSNALKNQANWEKSFYS